MKRICSFLLAVCFVLSGGVVFGAEYDKAFEALSNTVYSGEFEMNVSSELNSPLLISEVLEKLMFDGEDNYPVDLKLLLEGFFSSEFKAECRYNLSKDFKKANLDMNLICLNPIEINDSLKIDAKSKWRMWVQYDFAAETPVYRVIYKTPVSKKYIVMDMGKQLKDAPMETAKIMPDAEYINSIQEKMISIYKDNSSVSKIAGGYRLSIDDAGFKNICIGILDIMSELMEKEMLKSGIPKNDILDTAASFKQFKENAENVRDKITVIGKKGFTIDIKINSRGFITESKSDVNICLNVYDILNAFGEEEECSRAGITKENGSIDFNIKINENISKHNQNVKVEYPVLTEENSYYPMEDIPEYNEYRSKYNYFDILDEGVPVIINSVSYVKLRGAAENCSFDIYYENGTAYVDTKSSNGVLEIKADSNELIKNGEKINVNYPAVEIDGSIYVNEEILSYMGISINQICYDPKENATYADCYYEDPDFVEVLKEM